MKNANMYMFVWGCHFLLESLSLSAGDTSRWQMHFFCFYHSFSYHLTRVAMVILPNELPHGNTSFSLRKTCAS